MRARLTLKIGGEKRMLKFTLASMKRYDDEKGMGDGAALRLVMNNPMTAILELTKYALDYPSNENNLPETFTEDLVSDWIDDLSEKELKELVGVMMLGIKKFGDAFPKEEISELPEAKTPKASMKKTA